MPDLRHNERVKLAASFATTCAGAIFALGIVGPIATAFYLSTIRWTLVVSGCAVWFFAIMAFHGASHWILGRLKDA
jgi:hypothetical protein